MYLFHSDKTKYWLSIIIAPPPPATANWECNFYDSLLFFESVLPSFLPQSLTYPANPSNNVCSQVAKTNMIPGWFWTVDLRAARMDSGYLYELVFRNGHKLNRGRVGVDLRQWTAFEFVLGCRYDPLYPCLRVTLDKRLIWMVINFNLPTFLSAIGKCQWQIDFQLKYHYGELRGKNRWEEEKLLGVTRTTT